MAAEERSSAGGSEPAGSVLAVAMFQDATVNEGGLKAVLEMVIQVNDKGFGAW